MTVVEGLSHAGKDVVIATRDNCNKSLKEESFHDEEEQERQHEQHEYGKDQLGNRVGTESHYSSNPIEAEEEKEEAKVESQEQEEEENENKHVVFTTVEIREYDVTIGDNPWCSCGTPVCLDWNYVTNEPINIDDLYNTSDNLDCRLNKRAPRQMLLNYYKRRDLLWKLGYSMEEIERAGKSVDKDRMRRSIVSYFELCYRLQEIITLGVYEITKKNIFLYDDEASKAARAALLRQLEQRVREEHIRQHLIPDDNNYDIELPIHTLPPPPPNLRKRKHTLQRTISFTKKNKNQQTSKSANPQQQQHHQQQQPPDVPHPTHHDHLYQASHGSKYDKYSVRVDRSQHDKAVEVVLFNIKRPHMRAFHFSWLTFFIAFFTWFAITPLLGEVQQSLNLTKQQIWTSSLCGTAGTIFMRILMGPACDKFGARYCMAFILVASAIPMALTGLITSSTGLSTVRAFIGIAGASFVACQYWTSSMFAREVAGTANALVAGWGNLGGGITQIVTGSALFPFLRYIYNQLDNNNKTMDDDGNYDTYDEDTYMDASEKAWRTVFIIPAVLALIVAYIIIMYCDDSPKGDYRELVRQQEISVISPMQSLISSICNYNTIVLSIQYACCFGVEVTMTNATALYFRDQYSQSTVSAAAIASIFGIMNLFARGLGGAASDICNSKYGIAGRIYWQTVVLLLQGVAIIVFAISTTLVGSIFALIVTSIFVQSAEGSTFGIVPYVDRRFTGSVVGWVGAGGTVGSAIFSIFFREYHYKKAFILMGISASLGGLLSPLLNKNILTRNYNLHHNHTYLTPFMQTFATQPQPQQQQQQQQQKQQTSSSSTNSAAPSSSASNHEKD